MAILAGVCQQLLCVCVREGNPSGRSRCFRRLTMLLQGFELGDVDAGAQGLPEQP